ncbi:hypothetical protein [Saccharospirillum salsuginis]|uniref:MSHA biogenesis protein MshJ n=1 Tax=Saccharospirillum salsuginis TaxID=418750 RepID=A0A918N7Q8_9GAMM|nr:hypothetical protein [Saccharospirillum salsuginis]GGX45001.1 hypothetical protein GCM10007392_09760 [Saccharospirillum salsuginis]
MALTFRLRLLLDRFQPRERLLILITLMLVLGFAAYGAVWVTGLTQHDRLRDRIETLRNEFTANQNALLSLQEAQNNPRARSLSERNEALREELSTLEDRINRVTDVLIPPNRMANLLRELLVDNDLTLVRLGVQPASEIQTGDGDSGVVLYRHRLELDLQGSFPALIGYLEAIEDKPWQLFWDEISIETDNYPQLRIRLRVHTLSDKKEWLNV